MQRDPLVEASESEVVADKLVSRDTIHREKFLCATDEEFGIQKKYVGQIADRISSISPRTEEPPTDTMALE